MATIVNTQSFKELAAQDGLLVVDFFATWCGPCKKLSPILDEVAEEFAGKANIVKVDIDESEDLAVEFGIRSVPTVLFLKGGRQVCRCCAQVGNREQGASRALTPFHLHSSSKTITYGCSR